MFFAAVPRRSISCWLNMRTMMRTLGLRCRIMRAVERLTRSSLVRMTTPRAGDPRLLQARRVAAIAVHQGRACEPRVVRIAARVDDGDGFAGLAQEFEHAPADLAQPAQDEMLPHAASEANASYFFVLNVYTGLRPTSQRRAVKSWPIEWKWANRPLFQGVRAVRSVSTRFFVSPGSSFKLKSSRLLFSSV